MKRNLPILSNDPGQSTISRRQALSWLATIGTVAALPACRRPEEAIVPYVNQPEQLVPGKPLHFATALPLLGTAFGVVVETHDGRPTKIEGNSLHPESLGATLSFIQAAILDLYDPERSRSPRERGIGRSWQQADEMLRKFGQSLADSKGKGAIIVTEAHRSPTFAAAVRDFSRAFPEAQFVQYEPFSDLACCAALKHLYGTALTPIYELEHADVILSLEADILGLEGNPVRSTLEWSQRREPERGSMNRLYVIESTMTVTGANADHRFASESGTIGGILCAVVLVLAARGHSLPAGLQQAMERIAEASAHRLTSVQIAAIADDLIAHSGRSVIIVGDRQPAAIHALGHWLNHVLGNVGKTVRYVRQFVEERLQTATFADIEASVARGGVDSMLLLGVNPAYSAPGDVKVRAVLRRVPLSVHVGTHYDETAALCTWHLNRAHPLESWGDTVTATGVSSIVQPVISPMYDGRTDTEILRALLGKKANAYESVQNAWQQVWQKETFDHNWRRALHEGVVADSLLPSESVVPNLTFLVRALETLELSPKPEYEATFLQDNHVLDGRFANNPWLLELPDPITKLTWTNAARISEGMARSKGLKDGDSVILRVAGRSIEIPVIIVPGQAPQTIALTIGLGRREGVTAANRAGYDVNPLRKSSNPYLAALANIEKTSRHIELPRTQEHFGMEGRDLARSFRCNEVSSNASAISIPLHQGTRSNLARSWGLVIDLGKCTGCSACVVACQAENNIAVVGAAGVRQHRAMHWMRIDRYFEPNQGKPTTIAQPVICQQCTNAPCESVCPVGATSHSPEGLNDMTYNRCVGSRYCASNCPFKVRRFNYFEYWTNTPPTYRMQLNPNVTVRSRGVMEKCTFCVQRINSAKLESRKNGVLEIRDGTIKTACEQACPARAITFGDLNEPQSRVASLAKKSRSYRLLEALNLDSAVAYLAQIRNPNPQLES